MTRRSPMVGWLAAIALAALSVTAEVAQAQAPPGGPVLTAIAPNSLAVGQLPDPTTTVFTLQVNGSAFDPTAVVLWNGAALATTFVSANLLQATVPAGNIAAVGAAAVTVVSPVPDGLQSNAVTFSVTPLKATVFLRNPPDNGVFSSNLAGPKITLVLQLENVSGAPVTTTEGFSSTDFFRRLYFTDPQGGTITNTAEAAIHTMGRLFMCLSRGNVLQPRAIPVVPVESLLSGPRNTPANFFREYVIEDARTLFDLSRPGQYRVNARIPLLTFATNDPNAVIGDCDQVPGTVVNVKAVTGRTELTVVSNSVEFSVEGTPPVTAAPVVSGTAGSAGWFTSDATVSFSASSPGGATVQRIVVMGEGAQSFQEQSLPGATGSVTISTDGTTTLTYHAEDSAGLPEPDRTLTVKVDKTAPSVVCLTPGGGSAPDGLWHGTDQTFACTALDPTSGLANSSADASFTVTTSIADGTETSTATAPVAARSVCDVAGNCRATQVTGVQIDKKAPVVDIAAPADGATYFTGQTVLASYECRDASLLTCIGTVANGAAIATATAGTKTFTVTGTDAVDRQTVKTVSYTVRNPDDIPPVTTASVIPAWSNAAVSVTFTAVDNAGGSGVQSITLTPTGAQTTGGGTFTGATASITVAEEGVTKVAYFATDNAGNAEASKSLTVQIDKTKPVLAGLPTVGCSIWPPNRAMVQIATVTATDPAAGAPTPIASGVAEGIPKVTVTSNEPVQSGDIVVSGGVVRVRAARAGSGTDRIYTVTATATDKAGNTATTTGTCTVPHDQGKK